MQQKKSKTKKEIKKDVMECFDPKAQWKPKDQSEDWDNPFEPSTFNTMLYALQKCRDILWANQDKLNNTETLTSSENNLIFTDLGIALTFVNMAITRIMEQTKKGGKPDGQRRIPAVLETANTGKSSGRKRGSKKGK